MDEVKIIQNVRKSWHNCNLIATLVLRFNRLQVTSLIKVYDKILTECTTRQDVYYGM